MPSEDNPLAEGLDDGESAGDLLEEGKDAESDEGDEADTRTRTSTRTDGVP